MSSNLKPNSRDESLLSKHNLHHNSVDKDQLLDLLRNHKDLNNLLDIKKQGNNFILHILFAMVTGFEDLHFLKKDLNYLTRNHLLDEHGRTWLHIAVLHDRDEKVLKFLINELHVNRKAEDHYGFTALHFACRKSNHIEGEMNILLKETKDLASESKDKVTPLELACGNMKKLKHIMNIEKEEIDALLKQIDKISTGLPETKFAYLYNEKIPKIRMWISLLQTNNKYRLIYTMKSDSKFPEKYYMNYDEIHEIIKNCSENGQGIFTYFKNKKYFDDDKQNMCVTLFEDLTGFKIRNPQNTCERIFYKSSLFLALITGRLELVPILLMYCQFNIILYGMLTCLICKKFSSIEAFPDQIIDNIKNVKNFCEKYSILVLNKTVLRDLTKDKRTISEFLYRTDRLLNQRIIDVAYFGKCSKFLSLPSCQETLTKLWHKKNRNCPAAKFYFHATVHVVFLCLFSYILVNNIFSRISAIEILCYVYGLGFTVESIFKVYKTKKANLLNAYKKNLINLVDLCALVCMFMGFVLRCSLTATNIVPKTDSRLFEESRDKNLFFIRLTLCFSLVLFFMRIIYFGAMFKQFGPKLKMIGKMVVKDLLPLIFVFLIFITSFGIAFQSLLYPNSFYIEKSNQKFERKPLNMVISDIFRRATYTIFNAHYTLEEIELSHSTYSVNEDGKIAVYFLLVVYVIVVNVMLLNLLIALFSFTVTDIIQKSKESWKANRYKEINDYFDRSILPPPLNIIEIIIYVIFIIKNTSNPNADSANKNENHDAHIMPFKILQAFALKDCRYKLLQTQEDKEYEEEIKFNLVKKSMKMIKSTIYQIESALSK